MCGFVVAVNCDEDIIDWIQDSLLKLKRRGPDFAGFLKQENVYFGATRLAMVDKQERSNQPLERDGSILVFNGEIYNHAKVRAHLIENQKFLTNCDTEVLACILQDQGIEGLPQLNGMYAFVFFDEKNQKLLIARDRLGKKPLYYWVSQEKNEVFFSSLQTPLSEIAPKSLNNIALVNYLHLGFIVDPITMHQEVKSVKPMEAICLVKLKNELSFIKSKVKEPTYAPNRNLRKIITDCVMSRVHGENSVSFSLSGGLDSTVIAIVLAEQGIDATAFSVRWSDSDKDRYNQDFEIARRTAALLDLKFMPVDALNSKEVPNYLDKYLEIMEEPSSNPTGLSMISLYQEISSSGFRLTLTGDGSDEIFGGYARYKIVAKYQALDDWLKLSNWVKLKRFGLIDKIHRLNSSSWEDWASWHQVFSRKDLARQLKIASSEIDSAFEFFEEEFKGMVDWDEKSALKRMMLLDQKIWLAMESNRRLDRISMFYSVEARSPFQDDQLSALWQNRNKRQVLKRVGKRDLWDAFPELRKLKLPQKKVGFSSPLGHWLRANTDWTIQTIKWLESAGIMKPKVMLANEINADLQNGEYNKLQKLWTLVVLSIWLQRVKFRETM